MSRSADPEIVGKAQDAGSVEREPRYWFWALLVPALLYAATLYPGAGGRFGAGDAIKFQYIGGILSVPHEPGYPQYVALTFLWSHLPLPVSPATSIAMLSAVFALLAGAALSATARRVSDSPIAAVLATWLVLLSFDVWQVATQAEVYALNMAWVGAVLLCAWQWRATRERTWLVVLMFCYALSFGNHLLMITFLPALLILVVATDGSVLWSPRMLLAGSSAVFVGLAQYSLLWWRSYNPHPTMLSSFPVEAGFFEVLSWSTGERFTERHFLPDGMVVVPARFAEAWGHGFWQATPLLFLLALLGALVLWKRDRVYVVFLVLVAVSAILFASAYDIHDWLVYCIPAWMALGILAAAGIARFAESDGQLAVAGPVAILLVLGLATAQNFRGLRVEENVFDLDRLVEDVEDDAIIVSHPDNVRGPAQLDNYYRYAVGGQKAEAVKFVDLAGLLANPVLLFSGRPIYTQHPAVSAALRMHDVRQTPSSLGVGGERTYAVAPIVDEVSRIHYERTRRGLAVTLYDEPRAFDLKRGIHMTVIDDDDRSLLGTAYIRVGGSRQLRRPLRTASSVIGFGDWVFVLGLGLEREAQTELARALRWSGVSFPNPTGEPADVLLVYRHLDRSAAPLIVEFTDTATVTIPPLSAEGVEVRR